MIAIRYSDQALVALSVGITACKADVFAQARGAILRLMQLNFLSIAIIVVVVLGILHAMAAFFYFSRTRHSAAWAAGWLFLALACVWLLPDQPAAAGLVFTLAILGWTVWWASIRALPRRNWVAENARQATGEIAGNRLTLHDLRAFEWQSSHEFVPRWEDCSYDLDEMEALDLFVSTWGDPRMAHLIVSFVFRNAPPLAFSIETRRETTERWSSLAGFMKSYELIIIATRETDVVYVRTNIRRETVLLYRIVSTPEMRRRLLAQYIRELNRLATRPRFYNTLFSNCTTEVARIVRAAGHRVPFDWRILVSGYVPEYLYDLGLIDTSRPFAELRARADIGALARATDERADFSARIRRHLTPPGNLAGKV